jgi:type VI secretion system protein VasG
VSIDLRSLMSKLDETSRQTLEGAAGLCISRSHYDVEIEHWFAKLAERPDTDVARILAHFEISPDRYARDLARALDGFKTGNSGRPDLSPNIELLARDAWVLASVNYGLAKVRSGALLLAALAEPRLRRRLIDACSELAKINVEAFEKGFDKVVAGSAEDREVLTAAAPATRDAAARAGASGAGRATPALDQYTVDLTAAAKSGRIDPVVGREREIRQIIDILTRRRQNNPILTGEAGVGKTAVVEGFAQRVAAGDVPEVLKNVAVRTLDLGLLPAGAGVRGEFENRLKQVIEEVRSSAQPIVLFIDEAHTMIGAGGQAGQNDAANLLKPALARGELRTIAATTWAEYKKYFEKDPALSRRFQVVKVDEPDEEIAIRMMRGMRDKLESHHGVRLLDEAVVESVRLSHRYIAGRQLPDKSVSVLDTACAKVAIGQNATPASVEDLRRKIEALSLELGVLEKESSVGQAQSARMEEIRAKRAEAETALAALEERWERERALVTEIQELRGRIEAAVAPAETGEGAAAPAGGDAQPVDAAELAKLRAEHEAKRAELRALQAEEPLVLSDVDGQAVAEVISSWTGIPVGKMVADEIHTILHLADRLGERVIGQVHALETIARRVHTSRANLDNPSRPVGVFLLAGPSGVGKTETGLALADALYGGERNIVTINMSEYQEAHTVSSLKGSPPGYVGYGEGGVLTEAVRRRPYSVVLLDEVEKAHPDVMELFFQVFDKGVLEDGEGREIDFKNTLILLTSNVGSDTIMKLCADPETLPEPGSLVEAIRPELLKVFPAALLGRLVTVAYYPITPDMLRRIIRLQLDRIARRVAANHKASLGYSDDLVDAVIARCKEAESGARAVDHILTNSLLPQISAEILVRMAESREFSSVQVGVGEQGDFDLRIA